MTSKDNHQKHVALQRPAKGEFGRNELAFLGTPCSEIQSLVMDLARSLSDDYSIAYVDQDHRKPSDEASEGSSDNKIIMTTMTDKIRFNRFDTRHVLSALDKRRLLNQEDLIFVNGNHFFAQSQVIIIDPIKDLTKKLDRINNVKLILYKDKLTTLPDPIKQHLPDWQTIPFFFLEETSKITLWLRDWIVQRLPPIKGLVLAGGESKRMKRDKGELVYHGKNQRAHTMELLASHCEQTYLSCNAQQEESLKGAFPLIKDAFLDLGPMGGILSAFRSDPNSAWLTVACDLPYLSHKTIKHLISHRNASKVATTFFDSKGEFPEPLVTLWEPRAYSVLLDYLSQGYSCPRKVLINSEVEMLRAPDKREFYNVNFPEQYEEVLKEIKAEPTEKE